MKYNIIMPIIIFASQLSKFFASGDNVGLQMCMQNQTVSIEIAMDNDNNEINCQCRAGLASNPVVRKDYIHTPGVGSHKLHTHGKPWNEARRICNEENGHLAIINSNAEAEALLRIFQKEYNNIYQTARKEEAFLGIHDLFAEGEWLTIFGESLYSTGFSEWSTTCWGMQPDNFRNRQNCGALILNCGSMDDVNCDSAYPFFCELPLSCI